jgi:S-DNA-T family DNA segregation ATPase FtsK/SpoIIIE
MPEEIQKTPGAAPEHQTRSRLIGFLLLPLSLFPLLGLFTYDWRDISWLQVPANDPPANVIGIVGAWSTFAGYSLMGLALWLVPVWLVTVGVLLVSGRTARLGRRTAWMALFLVAACALLQLCDGLTGGVLARLNGAPNGGGAIGQLVMSEMLARWLSPVGGGMLAACALIGAGIMVVGPRRLYDGARHLAGAVQARWARSAEEQAARAQARTAQEGEAERDRLQREKEAARLAREQARLEKERARDSERQNKDEAAAERQQAADERRRQLAEEQQRDDERRGELRRKADALRAAAAQRDQKPPPEEAAAPQVAAVALPANAASTPPAKPPYVLPSINLLDPIPEGDAVHGDVERTAQTLVESLKTFNLDCEVTHIERGPVITQYELLPAPGIRVERIVALSNTLQLVLKATSLRVQAPVPGKGVVGIEVPNQVARKVTLREVLEGEAWSSNRMEIPLALGKDVSGRDLLIDLAQAPHLLVAGATGSGKSVCLNAILAGLLMRRTPDELKLMLVDPKRVEFPPYNDLPHLLVPVITDPKKVAFSLRWTLAEMDRRYKLLQATRQRNIVGYNTRAAMTQTDLFERNGGEAESALPAKLPYIVIVIDEVADLMMTVGQEIEGSITRLAQLSRAVGIHMVLATQRPSVNVITGTIKANFPGRIAFQVAQKVDSRTILDTSGAETLIGRGDMLFLNPKTSRLMRAQGALVNDGEINRLVEFIKRQGAPSFDQSLAARLEKVQELVADAGDDEEGDSAAGAAPVDGKDDADEELIQQSLQVIRDTRRASTSSLQRRLRIGYTRAARIIDILEERGILGPPRGSDPREILIDLDGVIPNNPGDGPAAEVPADAAATPDDEAGGSKG